MIRVSDLILAAAILVFFSLTNYEKATVEDIDEVNIESSEMMTIPIDSLDIEVDVYDSYADFTY